VLNFFKKGSLLRSPTYNQPSEKRDGKKEFLIGLIKEKTQLTYVRKMKKKHLRKNDKNYWRSWGYKMANDLFYRSMTDNQLQATFKEIEKNIEFDSAAGMIKEMEILRNVAKEQGIELGNPFDAVKGYVEISSTVSWGS
jgi:hypothetical protein